ncbi:MAG: HIT domain-containing protein [Nitrososphaerales archaeon]
MSEKVSDRIFNSASVAPERCIFCKIISRKLPSYILFEDETFIAFLDNHPFSEGHTLVCPKKHGETVWDMSQNEIGGLFMLASRVSKALVSATGADGFRFVQNNGEAANQVVPHVHVHVIPVRLSDKGKWLDRKKISPEAMEKIADRIRVEINR